MILNSFLFSYLTYLNLRIYLKRYGIFCFCIYSDSAFAISANCCILSCSARRFAATPAFSSSSFACALERLNPDERVLESVFLLWENAAFTTRKKSLSLFTCTGGSLRISRRMTVESTSGAGINEPLDTWNRTCGSQ